MDEGGGASRSTDPAAGTSAATDVSLREYLMQAIGASRNECREGLRHLEEMVTAAEANSKENIAKALLSIDRRFDNVNEFRGALSDLSKQMATKQDVTNLTDKVLAADEALESRFEALWQRNRDDIDAMGRRLDLRQGQEAGSKITTTTLVTVTTLAIAVIGVLFVAANYIAGR
jgi:hypothetical protein